MQMFDHRNSRIVHQAFDQALAAARDDHVDVVAHRDQLAHCCTIGGCNHLHAGVRQTGRLEPFPDAGRDRLVGADRFAAATQDRGIARLEAEARSVCGHIRARFINDADHAERHAHSAYLYAGRTISQVGDDAHRVGQGGDLLQAFCHAGNGAFPKGQPVQQGFAKTLRSGLGHVFAVGGEECCLVAPNCSGHRQQRRVLGRRIGCRDHPAGFPCGAAHAVHIGLDVQLFHIKHLQVSD
jgi:hypothetical protein